jgi:alkylation response protein AidB-like acyl-CoA dehydrogenase
MEILNYTDEHIDFRNRLRKFLETEVTPHVDQWEQDHIVPKHTWRAMGQAGFLCPAVSADYGGIAGDFLHATILVEEIMRTNHTGLAAPLHSDIVVPYIDSYASPELKARYLPGCVSGDIITAIAMTEPDAGSDLAALKTTAVENNDSTVLNGSKTFITNGINADLVIVAARDPEIENPYEAISLYLVEGTTPGFKRGRHLEKMGYHSQDTAELFFTDCRIPTANRLGDKGTGFLMLMEKLQQERLVCAVMGVAAAEFILAQTLAACKETAPGGRPLSKSQAVQFALVEMTTEVKLGRNFLDKLITDHMEGRQVVAETSMAKYWTTEMANRVADRCLDLVGETALLETYPLVRTFRDARVMTIFAGTNEVMKSIAAKFMGL